MGIPEQEVKKVILVYRPDYRVLLSANYEFPKLVGKLDLSKVPPYYNIEIDYLTIFGVQLSTLQLVFALSYEAMKRKDIPKNLSLEELWQSIVHKIDIKFKRKLLITQPFNGEIELKKLIKNRIAQFDFNLNDGACIGSLETLVLG